MSEGEIEAAVRGKHLEFDEIVVHFVPVPVERLARDNLGGAAPRHRA